MIVSTTKMEWIVYRYDINQNKIVPFNVFNHGRFMADVLKNLKKYENKVDFKKQLKTDLMYYFWSKYEYELILSEFCSKDNPASAKIDIYDQIRLNWDKFVDYTWSFKKPKRKYNKKSKNTERKTNGSSD